MVGNKNLRWLVLAMSVIFLDDSRAMSHPMLVISFTNLRGRFNATWNSGEFGMDCVRALLSRNVSTNTEPKAARRVLRGKSDTHG